MNNNVADPGSWVGRTWSVEDRVSRRALDILGSILPPSDTRPKGTPPLIHWTAFADIVPLAETGVDGHPARGYFLPPVTLPRRMWAGGALNFHHDLMPGEPVRRRSTISDISLKNGRNGKLCFVTVSHELFAGGRLCIEERQDIVYRDAGGSAKPAEPLRTALDECWDWDETVVPDPVMLFRYSAATTNSHRIHYDRPYATGEEGYSGLVVHGPLLAMLLADLAQRSTGRCLGALSFRAVRPVFDTAPFGIVGRAEGDGAILAVLGPDGHSCMTAQARFRDSEVPS